MYKYFFCASRLVQQTGGFLRKADRGVTAIEYALIALLIAIPIVGVVFAIGGQLTTIFTHVNNGFPSAS
jgi:Flp pilus assembly pilin Flp